MTPETLKNDPVLDPDFHEIFDFFRKFQHFLIFNKKCLTSRKKIYKNKYFTKNLVKNITKFPKKHEKSLWLYIRLPPKFGIFCPFLTEHINTHNKLIKINKTNTTTTDSLHGNDAEHPMDQGRGPKFLFRL
jgi:Zn-dependent M32 family carboxypeptidase